MIDHHLQRSIVYRLAFAPSLKFSELQPEGVENKLFDYHLKKVIAEGLVEKGSDGLYSLTAVGRRVGIDAAQNVTTFAEKAHSVLFLTIRRPTDSAWLLYRRKVHPLLNGVGFMHAEPNASESILVTASEALLQRTGLAGSFSVLGSGYFRVHDGQDIESFTHFTLLVCDDAVGELEVHDDFADYFWDANPVFDDPQMLPNMRVLSDKIMAGQQFFIERDF